MEKDALRTTRGIDKVNTVIPPMEGNSSCINSDAALTLDLKVVQNSIALVHVAKKLTFSRIV